MVILRVNDIQFNSYGVTLKTSRDKLKTWMRSIDHYYTNLNYEMTIKDLENNGKQHTYTLDEIKFTFEYYITGRIVVKTKHMEVLQHEFIDKHEVILGVKLETIGSLTNRSQSCIPTPKRHSSSASPKLFYLAPSSTQLIQSEEENDEDVGQRKKTPSEEYESLCEHELHEHRQDNEIAELKSEMVDLKEEVLRLKEQVKDLQTSRTLENVHIEDIIERVVLAHRMDLNETDIQTEINTRLNETAVEPEVNTQKQVDTHETPEKKSPSKKISVKHLTEHYQNLSEWKI